ncbi:MAG: hypothetical protein ABI846_15865 [Rudaea sp.]
MIANAALLAVLTVFLVAGWLAGELTFLAPYKAGLFRLHGGFIVGALFLLFFNLLAAYYRLARWLFLRDTGRKLRHLDHQLQTPDTVLDELRDDLAL